jgi:HSP20 family protein
MYGNLFARDVFAELDRIQREVNTLFNDSPSIRGGGRWPALNVGSTESSVEVYAFVPGLEPSSIDVNLDRGVLSIAGERKATLPRAANGNGGNGERQTLRVSIGRRESAKPRRITVN